LEARILKSQGFGDWLRLYLSQMWPYTSMEKMPAGPAGRWGMLQLLAAAGKKL
jgi:hypothetical protein